MKTMNHTIAALDKTMIVEGLLPMLKQTMTRDSDLMVFILNYNE
jgi:hypothetical protein